MIEKLRNFVKKRRNENGSADLVVTLFMLPLAVFLILALIDLSMYMNTRSSVESVVRDATRQSAMWGGTGTVADGVRLNSTGLSAPQRIANSLVRSGGSSSDVKCKFSNCVPGKAPVATCDSVRVANAGATITCSVTYYYKTVTPGTDLLGFSAITSKGFTITSTAISETGYR
jgi:Flp pilus assembly protein TadG